VLACVPLAAAMGG